MQHSMLHFQLLLPLHGLLQQGSAALQTSSSHGPRVIGIAHLPKPRSQALAASSLDGGIHGPDWGWQTSQLADRRGPSPQLR
jgi:hypothetical protein